MIHSDSCFINCKGKKLSWRNRNYYFIATITIVLLNIVLYAALGSYWGNISVRPQWGKFSVANLVQSLLNSYRHGNWQHVLLNMLCFFVAGLYLERKQGSLKFFLFIFIMSAFTAFACSANDLSVYWHGFSGVNYGLYGYILIEFVFTVFRKKEGYRFDVVFGLIVIGLIYLAMCFNGGTTSIGFEWYPYDLLHNLGHASGFAVGLIFGLYEQISAVLRKER